MRWLGFDWGEHLYHASDYFERLYGWAEDLIRAGKAYVDDQTQDEMRAARGTLTEPGKNSPFRERSVEENLDLFRRMRAGEFPNGARVLRAKIDMASGNINLRDPVLYRILHATHPRTGTEWKIYPSYDYAHGQSDAIEGITHSICTLEFEDHRPLYDWFIENLPVPSTPAPVRVRAAQSHLHGAVEARAQRAGEGRPRLRLGRSAHADARRACAGAACRRRRCAISPSASASPRRTAWSISALLDFSIREVLNKSAQRRMAVLRPLKVVIENYEGAGEELEAVNHPDDAERGHAARQVRPRDLHRAGRLHGEPAEEVLPAVARHRSAAALRLLHHLPRGGEGRGRQGHRAALHLRSGDRGGNAPDGRKVKATIHWVSAADSVPAEVRLYNPLFAKPEPDVANFANDLNPNSLEVLSDARVEPALAADNSPAPVQFERQGYFARDPDSAPGKPVFNRTVGLRDSYAKAGN